MIHHDITGKGIIQVQVLVLVVRPVFNGSSLQREGAALRKDLDRMSTQPLLVAKDPPAELIVLSYNKVYRNPAGTALPNQVHGGSPVSRHPTKTVISAAPLRGAFACTFSREPSTWRARDLGGCTHHMMVSATMCRAPSGSKGFARKGTHKFEVCSACATRQRAQWSAVGLRLNSARYELRRQRSRCVHAWCASQSCGSPGRRRPSPPPPPRWRRVARWRCTASPFVSGSESVCGSQLVE